MEERNELLAFGKEDFETAEDLNDRAEFLRLTRKAIFSRLRERTKDTKSAE